MAGRVEPGERPAWSGGWYAQERHAPGRRTGLDPARRGGQRPAPRGRSYRRAVAHAVRVPLPGPRRIRGARSGGPADRACPGRRRSADRAHRGRGPRGPLGKPRGGGPVVRRPRGRPFRGPAGRRCRRPGPAIRGGVHARGARWRRRTRATRSTARGRRRGRAVQRRSGPRAAGERRLVGHALRDARPARSAGTQGRRSSPGHSLSPRAHRGERAQGHRPADG